MEEVGKGLFDLLKRADGTNKMPRIWIALVILQYLISCLLFHGGTKLDSIRQYERERVIMRNIDAAPRTAESASSYIALP